MKILITILALAIVALSTTVLNAQVPLSKLEAKTEVKTKDVVHLKKDGTPDKCLKENKKDVVKPVKKDGTTDEIRYKVNKK